MSSFGAPNMSSIGQRQTEALLEAFTAAAALLPLQLRFRFILVGGVSLLSVGGSRMTEEVDVAITGPSLRAFYRAALYDLRFNEWPINHWTYTSSSGIAIPFEFLLQGGEFVPVLLAPGFVVGGGYRASLAELAIMKARTWRARNDEKDLADFRFLLNKMVEAGERFGYLSLGNGEDIGDFDAVREAVNDAGWAYFELLLQMMLESYFLQHWPTG